MRNYAIKDSYRENPDGPAYFLDDPKGRPGDYITFQPDVYPYAEQLAVDRGLTRFVDVGCGYAEKLMLVHLHHPEWTFVGVDHGANIVWCHDHYASGMMPGIDPWGEWLPADLDDPESYTTLMNARAGGFLGDAVVVCSDVIEHLRYPEYLLDWLRASRPGVIVLSTPERDLTWGVDHDGPPPNLCHVREWNRAEFLAYLEHSGFTVENMSLTNSDTAGTGERTILATVHAR